MGRRGSFAALTLGALGIVYGDIGTSPLYALDQFFFRRAGGAPAADVLGGISLVIWTITLIVAIKYAILVLRAQNDGEGGVFALYGLLHEYKKRGTTLLLWSLMLGAGIAFRRRHDHPGDQRAVGRRGAATSPRRRSATPSIPITVALLTRSSPCSSRAPPASAAFSARFCWSGSS